MKLLSIKTIPTFADGSTGSYQGLIETIKIPSIERWADIFLMNCPYGVNSVL
jgi:hypothetical protein